ncbi:hypothetical protein RJT51_18525 [Klebsiella variicola]|uniref:hypothetical protein n=1 Tax=Klebsiella variicola TaxID=244366 RepID=UPI001D0DAB16|nr:hypothetical protein [Klebsiella variicola]WNN05442.1 hypothetical protein RJT51_18525 [Klebsiella variicola]
MTSKLTREQLEEWVTQFDEDGGCDATDRQLEALIRQSLAAMDSEPVAWTWHYREQWHVTNDKCRAEFVATDGDVAVLPLYRHAQPAPEKYNIGDATMRHIFTPTGMTNVSDMQAVFDRVEAVLVGMERTAPEYPEVLPCPVLLGPWLRFGKGIKTSTMLAALARRAVYESDMAALSPEEIAEFQARIEDFKALIAQPAPVVPDDVLDALQKVARIRLDLNDFDGDRRGIADCLCDAEEALIEVVNRRADMLAAAPQPQNAQQNIPEIIPNELIAAVNRLLDSNGSRGCYNAIKCYDAHIEVERLLAAARQEVKP